METPCWVWIMALVMILILLIFGGILVSFAILRSFKARYIQNYRLSLVDYCSSMPPVEYRYPLVRPEKPGIYNYNSSNALLDISLAVSASNCLNILPLPNPPGFTQQYRLVGSDPFVLKDGWAPNKMYGYIFTDPGRKRAIFAFTGTFLLSQWVADATYGQVPPTALHGYVPGVLAHRGFYSIYLSIRDQLLQFYRVASSTLEELYITGHSLGGALSTLCAFDFAPIAAPALLTHYSFAAPRSGNDKYAEVFNTSLPTTLRIANTEDIVPQLPPAVWVGYIYEQTGGLVSFTANLGNSRDNHIKAYIRDMPRCLPDIAPCK